MEYDYNSFDDFKKFIYDESQKSDDTVSILKDAFSKFHLSNFCNGDLNWIKDEFLVEVIHYIEKVDISLPKSFYLNFIFPIFVLLYVFNVFHYEPISNTIIIAYNSALTYFWLIRPYLKFRKKDKEKQALLHQVDEYAFDVVQILNQKEKMKSMHKNAIDIDYAPIVTHDTEFYLNGLKDKIIRDISMLPLDRESHYQKLYSNFLDQQNEYSMESFLNLLLDLDNLVVSELNGTIEYDLDMGTRERSME